ncbi:hypothetical protein J3L11_05160, partial [Shewanella sp. 4t3-1-2LB]|uniref:hypothetical protein n=1 Tax=Shewanella sp. 4t3-1-2LB TaxID=2817682 RepID=UPI001A97DF43
MSLKILTEADDKISGELQQDMNNSVWKRDFVNIRFNKLYFDYLINDVFRTDYLRDIKGVLLSLDKDSEHYSILNARVNFAEFLYYFKSHN